VLGKLGYLAPEQIMGDPLDRRVDIFAAGATLFHLAALEKPFDTLTGSTLDPRRRPTVPLRALRPDLPPAMVDAIERALSVDVDARFATARDLRNALPVPGPDAAEDLGRLVRRVCAAALIDLETKTERASHALEAEPPPRRAPADEATAESKPTGARGTEALPQAAVAASQQSLTPLRNRTPWYVLGALALVGLGSVGGWFATREAAPVPAVVDAGPSVAVEARVPLAPAVTPDAAVATAEAGAPDAGGATLARAPEATPRGVGLLTVEAIPWGNVTLDNKDLGQTPTAEVRVPAGVHLMVVSCPDTNRTVKKKITVVAGQHLRVPLDLR
jgi:serine/threonine-protein kinase